MKKILYFAMACAGILAISCQKDSNSNDVKVASKGRVVTLSASVDALKTTYADDKTFSWVAGDAISVMVSNGEETKAVEFTTEQSGASVFFTGTLEEGYDFTGKAFYPSNMSPRDTAGTYALNLVTGIMDSKNPMSRIPLVGELDGETLYFHTAVGVMKFTVKNIPEPAFYFALYANVPLSGEFMLSEDGLIKMENAVEKNASGMVYSYFEKEKEQTFYFPVPVGTLPAEGYEITVENVVETALVDKLGSVDITIAPNSLTVVNPITCPDYVSPYKFREDWTAEYEAEDDLITVNCDASYFYFVAIKKANVEQYGIDTYVELYGSDMESLINNYGIETLIEYEILADSTPYTVILSSWMGATLSPGDYVVLIVGLNAEGKATGEYGAIEITIPEASKAS
ncbi:MAG: hypothetical protein II151_04820, partial [Bacteroidales bacterium]|nr:hypothetical protein [Bacteroidales bacterium]